MTTFFSYPVDAFLLLGPTGVGKSPLGDAVAAQGLFNRRCHHLDFGSELRDAASVPERSTLYSAGEIEFIRGVLEQGLLLENEHFALAEKIIDLFLSRVGFRQSDILVLNGMPRHTGQAADIASRARIHGLIVLDCSGEDVFQRIRTNVGGDRTERSDDDRELIAKKLEIFRERTAPLISHYETLGRRIYRITVTGSMTPPEAYRRLSALAAVHPPVTLVAEPPQR